MSEQQYWDTQAAADPGFAAWAADGWDEGIEACLNLIPRPTSGGTVLDLGCGGGRLLLPLAERHPDASFYGVDISPVMLASAATNAPGNVQLLQCDGRTLPDTPQLDLAYSVLMFQHIPDAAVSAYLHQIAARLTPGGSCVFQYVVGQEDTPMNRHRSLDTFASWCTDAGLTLVSHVVGRIYDNWAWATAVKS